MSVPKSNRTSTATVPVTNINTYIRVTGKPPYPLGRALQEWDDLFLEQYQKSDPGEKNPYWVREVRFNTPDGTERVVVNEEIYETALYTRATKRFTDWMRAKKAERDNAKTPSL